MGQVLSEDWVEKTRWARKQEAVKFEENKTKQRQQQGKDYPLAA